MPERPAIHVHLLPSLVPPGALAGGVAVVIDVLRATTVMVHALAHGCAAIIPCAEIDEARAVAAGYPRDQVLLGGERGGAPIPGFDLGNSPGEYTEPVCRGKALIMTTTNGTRAILASQDAERVLVAGFVNRSATIAALAGSSGLKRPVHLVCAGTEGHISLEDALLAGALAKELAQPAIGSLDETAPLGNDEAFIAVAQWLEVERSLDRRALPGLLRAGRGGRNVRRLGLAPDIEDAARVDRFPIVAELRRGPLRIIRAG